MDAPSSRTNALLPLQTYYSQEDGPHRGDGEVPGQFPFSRGIYETGYQKTPWMMQQVLGYGLADDTRQRIDELVASGMEGYFGNHVFNLVFDNPTKAGIDPDRPEAKGHVGVGGMSFSNIGDLEVLLEGFDLPRVHLSLITGDTCPIALGMYAAYARRRGVDLAQLNGNSMNWLMKGFCVDNAGFPAATAPRLVGELIRYATENMPRWNTTNLAGYLVRQAGANAVQELAFSMQWGINTIEAGIAAGADPENFVARLGFQIAFHSDFFEEIAKLRAWRRVWAKIVRDRFGVQNPRAQHARMHVHTAGDTLTTQQPINNTVRIAIETLGAVLGGTNSIHTCAYTESVSIPTVEAARLALRTQQIVLHETGVPKVTDPLGGSYFVEALTDEMEAAAWKLIEQIDDMGGFVPAIESGWMRQQLIDEAYRWQEQVRTGERVIVGVNKYRVEEETPQDVFRIDPAIEEEGKRRIEALRARRDEAKVKRLLKEIRVAAESEEPWMELIVEAMDAEATQGEVMDVLKDVYGWEFQP